MFAPRYFTIRYWCNRFWPASGAGAVVTGPPAVTVEGINVVRTVAAKISSTASTSYLELIGGGNLELIGGGSLELIESGSVARTVETTRTERETQGRKTKK